MVEIEEFINSLHKGEFSINIEIENHLLKLCSEFYQADRCRDYVDGQHLIDIEILSVAFGSHGEVKIETSVLLPEVEMDTTLFSIHNLGRYESRNELKKLNLPDKFIWDTTTAPLEVKAMTCDHVSSSYCRTDLMISNQCLTSILQDSVINNHCTTTTQVMEAPSYLQSNGYLLIASTDEEECQICEINSNERCQRTNVNTVTAKSATINCRSKTIQVSSQVKENIEYIKLESSLTKHSILYNIDTGDIIIGIAYLIFQLFLLVVFYVYHRFLRSRKNLTTAIDDSKRMQQKSRPLLAIEEAKRLDKYDDYITIEPL